jgi:phage-related minor tail protein
VTEDQVRELAGVSADMKHLMRSMEEIKTGMSMLATKTELERFTLQSTHDTAVDSLRRDIADLKKQIEGQSAASWMDRIKTLAMTIAAVAAAGGVLTAAVHWADKVK